MDKLIALEQEYENDWRSRTNFQKLVHDRGFVFIMMLSLTFIISACGVVLGFGFTQLYCVTACLLGSCACWGIVIFWYEYHINKNHEIYNIIRTIRLTFDQPKPHQE